MILLRHYMIVINIIMFVCSPVHFSSTPHSEQCPEMYSGCAVEETGGETFGFPRGEAQCDREGKHFRSRSTPCFSRILA